MPRSASLRKEKTSENAVYQGWLAEFLKRRVRDGGAKQPAATPGFRLKSSSVYVRIVNTLVNQWFSTEEKQLKEPLWMLS